jgi:hypothetical protein
MPPAKAGAMSWVARRIAVTFDGYPTHIDTPLQTP